MGKSVTEKLRSLNTRTNNVNVLTTKVRKPVMCAGAWHLIVLHCSEKQNWPDVWSLWGLCEGLDNESIQTTSAKSKGRPPTLRSMQQAATCWLLPLPTLPDGGLITGAACSPNPWVSPAGLDTMQDAKLCLSLYWTVTLVCACSICLPHSLILFRSLPHCAPCFLVTYILHIVLKH